jgi:hypothetical protein
MPPGKGKTASEQRRLKFKKNDKLACKAQFASYESLGAYQPACPELAFSCQEIVNFSRQAAKSDFGL